MQLPKGFRYSGLACGIKASGKPDLAVIAMDQAGAAAGVYTENQVVAAPVLLCRARTPGLVRALVVNSGNANACTGQQGEADAQKMVELVGKQLGCPPSEVLVMSTGVIGHVLPMPKIETGIASACGALDAGEDSFHAASHAIMTTDQGPKTAHTSFATTAGETCSLAGMAKGAGMIGPKMATMLAMFMTDLDIPASALQSMLNRVADRSFNCISVEGHTSTNDSMVVMTSGKIPAAPQDMSEFEKRLLEAAIELAKKIPADGEGASHLIEINVRGAQNDEDAREIANCIANSALVKTAITGNDPNWGRIVSAAGYAKATVDVGNTTLKILDTVIFEQGSPMEFDAARLSGQMRDAFEITVDLTVGTGPGAALIWTSDLTVDYVRFNSDYTT